MISWIKYLRRAWIQKVNSERSGKKPLYNSRVNTLHKSNRLKKAVAFLLEDYEQYAGNKINEA